MKVKKVVAKPGYHAILRTGSGADINADGILAFIEATNSGFRASMKADYTTSGVVVSIDKSGKVELAGDIPREVNIRTGIVEFNIAGVSITLSISTKGELFLDIGKTTLAIES